MPSQTFTHTARTPASSDEAWEALQRAETWGAIGGVEQVSDVTHDAEGRLQGYRFTALVANSPYRGRATTTRLDPPRAMTVQISSEQLEGTIEVTLSPDGDGTEVSVRLTATSRGFLAAMAFPAIASAIGSGLGDNVERFAARLG